MKKNYDLDMAIIMKKIVDEDGIVHFIPDRVAEGIYHEEDGCFYDIDGTPYPHIITNPESFGYCDRLSLASLKEGTKFMSTKRLKELRLKFDKMYSYTYVDDYDGLGFPVISTIYNKDGERSNLCDGDIVKFYYDNYEKIFFELLAVLDIGQVSLMHVDANGNQELVSSISGEELRKKILNMSKEPEEEKESLVNTSNMYKELTSHVIGQDKPIKQLLGILWKYYNSDEPVKPNILINGGTGVGKTQIFRIFSKMVDVPCVVTSATEYSATGYVGANIEDMLAKLIRQAGGDLEKAQNGILIIDEIDKISESDKGRPQINQKDVQDGLLKVLEDGVVTVKMGNYAIEFDTSKLLVIGMGSWCRAEKEEKKSIGFNSTGKTEKKKSIRDISPEEMVSNGMSKELIGRFMVHIKMNDLDFDDYVNILRSDKHMISYNKRFFEDLGIKLTIGDDVIEKIAESASKGMFGARNLAKQIESALSIAQFEISQNPSGYQELIITSETIEDEEKYTLVKKDLHK